MAGMHLFVFVPLTLRFALDCSRLPYYPGRTLTGSWRPVERDGYICLDSPLEGKAPLLLCAVFRSASVSGPSGALELNVKPPRTRAWSMFGKVAGQVWALGRFVLQPHEWKQRVRESGLPAGGCWFYWRHWARPAALRAPSASRLLLGLSCLAQGP